MRSEIKTVFRATRLDRNTEVARQGKRAARTDVADRAPNEKFLHDPVLPYRLRYVNSLTTCNTVVLRAAVGGDRPMTGPSRLRPNNLLSHNKPLRLAPYVMKNQPAHSVPDPCLAAPGMNHTRRGSAPRASIRATHSIAAVIAPQQNCRRAGIDRAHILLESRPRAHKGAPYDPNCHEPVCARRCFAFC